MRLGDDFTLIVNPVASQPTISEEQSTISGLEDELHILIILTQELKLVRHCFNVNDADESESIVAVNVSELFTDMHLLTL